MHEVTKESTGDTVAQGSVQGPAVLVIQKANPLLSETLYDFRRIVHLLSCLSFTSMDMDNPLGGIPISEQLQLLFQAAQDLRTARVSYETIEVSFRSLIGEQYVDGG